MKLKPIIGPATLDLALEHARKGRPGLLLLLIGDAMRSGVQALLRGLLAHPEKMMRQPFRARVTPSEAAATREQYPAMLAAAQRTHSPREAPGRVARSLGLEWETLRDILEAKHTYAESGEQMPKRSPRKRKE